MSALSESMVVGCCLMAWLAPGAKLEEVAAGSQHPASATVGTPPRLVPLAGDRVLKARPLRALRPEIAVQILDGEDGGPISLTGFASVVPRSSLEPEGSRRNQVLILVEIDGPSFLESAQGPDGLARVELYAYALRTKRIVGHLAQTVFVDLGELRETIRESGLRFLAHMDLPGGHYDLRIMVRNFHGRATGLRTLTLEIPEAGPGSQITEHPGSGVSVAETSARVRPRW